MSRDHPVDAYGRVPPAARQKRCLWVPQPLPEGAIDSDWQIAPAMLLEASIKDQASDIIEAVLADTDPGLADIQRRLRRHVANHPGSPSKALLAHLLETRRRSSPGS
ncbi:hypothetical protein QFZ65_002409 [Arthrobacter sp. B3I9]|uniref:hypothetical protein n=1 Tax=Arthrobacter sp. B3I9 TaxID=3042270 RepID=UPI002794A5E7|nr:hypothetical protein [Arthrobacter sp. B3I9]MDQ0850471.1 hypothetical protein [Arthrobacter sp. B3I9]